MDILTTVVFLLDTLEIQCDLKKKLYKKQIQQIENLIKVLYQKSNTKINEDEYLTLDNIHRSKLSSSKTHDRKMAMINTIERIKHLLSTGTDLSFEQEETDDVLITTLDKAYNFISAAIKDEVKEILNQPLIESDVQKLKCDLSENASLEIARLYLESGCTKEEFCKRTYITYSRLNKALAFVLNSDENEELKDQIYHLEASREEELKVIEQVMVNYNRRSKNINLLEFQSLSSQTISRTLAILKERNSIAYPYLNELYKEYQNRLRLAPFTFESLREMKTTINGRQMNDEDYDVIEQFFKENNYPKQRAIFTYVREAYLKGDLESVRRENLRKTVVQRFLLDEKAKEKLKEKDHK